jgi:hypothetical protein
MAEYTPMTMENYLELRAAIFEGAQSVSYSHPGGNKSVTYRSLDDMLRLLKLLAQELGIKSTAPRRTLASFSKGYNPRAADSVAEGGECFSTDGRCCP